MFAAESSRNSCWWWSHWGCTPTTTRWWWQWRWWRWRWWSSSTRGTCPHGPWAAHPSFACSPRRWRWGERFFSGKAWFWDKSLQALSFCPLWAYLSPSSSWILVIPARSTRFSCLWNGVDKNLGQKNSLPPGQPQSQPSRPFFSSCHKLLPCLGFHWRHSRSLSLRGSSLWRRQRRASGSASNPWDGKRRVRVETNSWTASFNHQTQVRSLPCLVQHIVIVADVENNVVGVIVNSFWDGWQLGNSFS